MQLDDPITQLPQVSTRYEQKLERLGILTIRDLLLHFPRYHRDTTKVSEIVDIDAEGEYTIKAKTELIKSIRLRGKRSMQRTTLQDDSGNIATSWFNQPYIVRAIKPDTEYLFSGKVKQRGTRVEFYPNAFEEVIENRDSVHVGRITPQYPLTQGVGIKWLRGRIKYLLDQIDLIEGLEQDIKVHPQLITEIKQVHFPNTFEEYETARFNLGVIELAEIQLQLEIQRNNEKQNQAPILKHDPKQIEKFIKELPFKLTPDQKSSVDEILKDIQSDNPMFRLLQGDVGSGKTIVAIVAALATKLAGYQTVILTPTTVLAEQHYQTFSQFLEDHVEIELVTGDKQETKAKDILIGTSAVLHRKKDLLKSLGLVVVDEQHRFGVSQRNELVEQLVNKEVSNPHLLDMTATPIPRTMALALFGDVQVSNITTKPKGRLPINTRIVPETKRSKSYEWVQTEVVKGNQVYWIAPFVEESEVISAKAVTNMYSELEVALPEANVALLHGRLPSKEKTLLLDRFQSGEIDVLVSTTVIEVGIDNPNAGIIIIESPERFGLAQLHQLRGRVGRGTKQSWCFLMPGEEVSDAAKARLSFFAEHNDGLEIAAYDLEIRGPGEVYGTQQAGVPDLKIAQINNLKQLQASRKLAKSLHRQGYKHIDLFAKTAPQV